MTGIIRFAAFSAALIALLVFVVIPVVAGPIIRDLVRDSGVAGDDVEVSVDVMGPSILAGRIPLLRLQAEEVKVPRATIGRMDVTLRDVSAADRSFGSISGTLGDVRVVGPGGLSMVVGSIDLEGPAEATRATGRLDRSESEALVEAVATSAGLTVHDVTLGDGTLAIRQDGQRTEAQLRVAGEALILDRSDADPVVLMAPAPSEPWRLRDIRITPDGMTVELTLDLRDLAAQVIAPAP